MLIPVVLSGGAGTRLWPVSREDHPKPFMVLSDGQSLLLKTYLRAQMVAPEAEILTVTGREYFFKSREELAKTQGENFLNHSFLLEPIAKNTMPAVAMAALYVTHKYGQEAQLLVLPADHLIQNKEEFSRVVAWASSLAQQDFLVTFGITPTTPETGFGYIELGTSIDDLGYTVQRFVEKPTLDKAHEYVSSKKFLWNAGMFCFKANRVLAELATHAPDVLLACEDCWREMNPISPSNQKNNLDPKSNTTNIALEIPLTLFEKVRSISIDYAIMEPSKRVAVVAANIGWSDIGSWQSIKDVLVPDAENNRVVGDVLLIDSKNTFIQSEDRLVAAVGIDNLMIVDTPDALLVAHPDKAQDVKRVVEQLKLKIHGAYKEHKTVMRPWGAYTILDEGPGFKIKRIEVRPGASLSLQMHHHRHEHWVVVSGEAEVVNGEKNLLIKKNESTYIPAGTKHRLSNQGQEDLVLIEVQSGGYLGEDDIVRFQDDYGRA